MAKRSKPVSVGRDDVLRIAAASGADVRTVNRFFDGGSMKRSSARAIEMSLIQLGIADPRSLKASTNGAGK